MSLSPQGIRTTDLIQFLLDHGFVPGARGGTETDFTHSGGAVITVPMGTEEVPPGFARALVQQFAIMDLADADELTRILLG